MSERYYRLRCRKTGDFVRMDEAENFHATGDPARADVFCQHMAPNVAFSASARLERDFRLVFAFRGDLCEMELGRVAAERAVQSPRPGSVLDRFSGWLQ